MVISLGQSAEDAVRREFGIVDVANLRGPIEVGGQRRLFAFLPHPNAFAPKTAAKCLTEDERALVRAFLST